MDKQKRDQLYKTLDETIQEILYMEYDLEPGDPGGILVAEWVVSAGVVGFDSTTNPNGDVQLVAPENLPLWRCKGLLSSAENYLNTVESHNYLVGLHAEGEEDE